MPLTKKIMLEGRLHKRLRATNHSDFTSYIKYLFSDHGILNEVVHMIDVVTTNKTDFFREPHHFEFLAKLLSDKNILLQFLIYCL